MLIVQVFVHVKPEFVDAFKLATLDNATNSIREPGVGSEVRWNTEAAAHGQSTKRVDP